jgi:superfamily II DNA helicase RecQ
MIQYVQSKEECRTLMICRYFGDEVKPCGQCDYCTRKNAGKADPSAILKKLRELLTPGPMLPAELMEQLEVEKNDARKLIDFLIAEGKLSVTGEGKVMIHKGL